MKFFNLRSVTDIVLCPSQIKKLKSEVSSLEKKVKKLQMVDPEKEMEKAVDARVRSSLADILPADKVA